MVGWHHQLNGCEFERALGVGDGQGGLAWCSSWGVRESDTIEQLNKSPPAVILEPKKIKSVTASTFSPSICHEVIGPLDAIILVFRMLSCLFVCFFKNAEF